MTSTQTLPTETRLRALAVATMLPGFTGSTLPEWVGAELRAGLGGVCLYGGNIRDHRQLEALCAQVRDASPGALLALDEEGGDVTRLHYLQGSNQPGNAVLGRLDDPQVTAAAAAAIGAELRALGVNLNLAPDADVNSNPLNPVIGARSFGANAPLVARHTAAWVRGLQGTGVAACAKHFPGHGDTSADSHLELPSVAADLQTLRGRELAPFAAAIAAGVGAIMTSHLMLPALDEQVPATFSRRILTDLLRGELGFGGAIVTDALDMAGASAETGIEAAAVRALAAGADLLCLGVDIDQGLYERTVGHIVQAVQRGELTLQRLRQAAANSAALARRFPANRPASPAAAVAAAEISPGVPTGGQITAAFELNGHARTWLADPAPAALVQVDSQANMAVGFVPWGPACLGADIPLQRVAPGQKIALIGRGLDAAHPVPALAQRLRAQGRQVLVVDCGWPRAQAGADVITFGASRAVSAALVELLTGTNGGRA